jgi:transposase-like protein
MAGADAERIKMKREMEHFGEHFPSEEECRSLLWRLRWPQGVTCPRCRHDQLFLLAGRKLQECAQCGYQLSPTAGTLFHRTRTPLRKWFYAIYRLTTAQDEVSVAQLGRELGISNYPTVWNMVRKLRGVHREGDSHRLTALVKMDAALLAPTSSPRPEKAEGGEHVILALTTGRGEDSVEAPGSARVGLAPDVSPSTIGGLLEQLHFPDWDVRPLIEKLYAGGWERFKARVRQWGEVPVSGVYREPERSAQMLPWIQELLGETCEAAREQWEVSAQNFQEVLTEMCEALDREMWSWRLFTEWLRDCVAVDAPQ